MEIAEAFEHHSNSWRVGFGSRRRVHIFLHEW
jgi:hypothetical protein